MSQAVDTVARTPLHVTGELLAVKKVGAYHHLTMVAAGIPERFRPGTFVALSVGESRLARRCFWIHRVKPVGGYGATLQLVVEAVGPGTRWLTSLTPGARVEVTADPPADMQAVLPYSTRAMSDSTVPSAE